ncbi:MAG: DUF167 domain-containing protein [Candidatus Omnitrophica bacterium]|nr:DUF167 domain-containing protein [Candidatus Omnitrophota bacterium]
MPYQNIRVIPKAKQTKILEESWGLKVYVTASAEKGKANKAAIEVLANHFGVTKSQIRFITGFRSRDKVVEIRK